MLGILWWILRRFPLICVFWRMGSEMFLKVLNGGVMHGAANACYDDDGQKYSPT